MACSVDHHSKNVSHFPKPYTSDDYKYNSISANSLDSLDHKPAIIVDFFRKYGATSAIFPDAFSLMLRGRALQFYFTTYQNQNLSILEIFDFVDVKFEGQEQKDNLLS